MANNNKPKPDRHQGTAVFARLPKDLYEQLHNQAKSERRTIGAQLIIIIEKHFSKPEQPFSVNTPMGNRPEDFKP